MSISLVSHFWAVSDAIFTYIEKVPIHSFGKLLIFMYNFVFFN